MITAQHQLGEFIVAFQRLEEWIDNLLVLLAETPEVAGIKANKVPDNMVVRILVNELEFSQRVTTTDVLFSYIVDVATSLSDAEKKKKKSDFHKSLVKVLDLAKRRNNLVHSKYYLWKDIEGNHGLIRQNAKLKASKGARVEEEELQVLERFRLEVINWQYPEIPA